MLSDASVRMVWITLMIFILIILNFLFLHFYYDDLGYAYGLYSYAYLTTIPV